MHMTKRLSRADILLLVGAAARRELPVYIERPPSKEQSDKYRKDLAERVKSLFAWLHNNGIDVDFGGSEEAEVKAAIAGWLDRAKAAAPLTKHQMQATYEQHAQQFYKAKHRWPGESDDKDFKRQHNLTRDRLRELRNAFAQLCPDFQAARRGGAPKK
jgi:hypothetical protein